MVKKKKKKKKERKILEAHLVLQKLLNTMEVVGVILEAEWTAGWKQERRV
jgi:hypothetical protein